MKNLSRTGSRVLIMLLVQIMVLGLLMPASAQADEPNGLVNVNDKYYFYSNGKAVHNKWIKAPVDGVMQKFYFGKSGAACKAGRLYENAYNVKLFRIKGVKYGFDMNSFLVKPGIYVNGASVSSSTMTLTIYYRYNSTSTGTINGNYTARVYGVKLYDLIGG